MKKAMLDATRRVNIITRGMNMKNMKTTRITFLTGEIYTLWITSLFTFTSLRPLQKFKCLYFSYK